MKKFSLLIGLAAVAATTPLHAQPRGDEPIAVPRTIKQGIDFVYVDPKMSEVGIVKTVTRPRPRSWLQRLFGMDVRAAQTQRSAPHPLYFELARGLQQYQMSWGRLPQVAVPAGAVLKPGASGNRVAALRSRLGMPTSGGYDQRVVDTVKLYQRVHGLAPIDGIAGKATIASLNRGPDYYARRIAINIERASRLPQTRSFERYVVVDSGAAEAYLFQNDRAIDGMRVIVGAPETTTPMIAVLMRNAKANPYWNVPPELIQSMTAKRVRQQGLSYLKNFHYEVLSDWGSNAQPVDPKQINWKAVSAGKSPILVRQLPGPWNSMGNMKFEMPNDYGIYLHDTPVKENFAKQNRWISNGCVRLQDYRRFANWVFGYVPQPATNREQRFDLPKPVPVFLTYMTVRASQFGVEFRPDPYGWDEVAMPQLFGPANMASLPGAAPLPPIS